MRDKLRSLLLATYKSLESQLGCRIPDDFQFDLDVPKNKTHGDFAANLALRLKSLANQNPREIARTIKQIIEQEAAIPKELKSIVKEIRVEGPGFLNFFLTQNSRADVLSRIHTTDRDYGCSDDGKGKKVLIEFVSANPTGPLTIAHGRQAAIGDTLARILSSVGCDVKKEFYLNDAGRQINLLGQSVWAAYRMQHEGGESDLIPADGYHGEYIKIYGKDFYTQTKGTLVNEVVDVAIQKCTQYAVEVTLNQIKEDLRAIGVVFDFYYEEHQLHEKGKVESAINTLQKKGYLKTEEGALWFKSTDFGDDKDRVLKKSNGELTYLTADIAYHLSKFERGFKQLVNLWGPDHHGYVARLKAACQALGYPPAAITILLVQLTTLYRNGEPVRMSTRAGQFVTLKELTDEVGADAARFFFLMRRVESHLDFDLELAKAKSQDNPVYYLQYAHARIAGILKNADRTIEPSCRVELLTADEEIALMKQLAEYPEVLKQAARSFEPFRLVDYLQGLAALFHKFYSVCRVISEDSELTKVRLLLTDCVRIVLRNGLEILGISHPDKM
ncbi:MAG: arginine--tRNA ligase [Candidatus Omnitrophica bacterium CG11_big_fil_rev_8_21_14_0_20_45_26]|uniref:Arginine--tRNA ligase n=1 Tax=Candidatus Abzuiibacterium crystallinum TaxID=1974748 RepID=A0A2H0LLU3_9BACT|nr:MAG: arginine--tRNA ligase [Candidatus Omnitrophica bacterium CG11_big_fil_rev_8_21_14_0_20_45_26]PIW63230.1 MAG: arginine--tRNA ligase [Candidatus Omnitrophica bacterium CG12_big_fil_rev_8_21_14_0_65_45_16]